MQAGDDYYTISPDNDVSEWFKAWPAQEALFDESCWLWAQGPNFIEHEIIKFHLDGTYETIFYVEPSGTRASGTYEYIDGMLTLCADPLHKTVEKYLLAEDGTFISEKVYNNGISDFRIYIYPGYEELWEEHFDEPVDVPLETQLSDQLIGTWNSELQPGREGEIWVSEITFDATCEVRGYLGIKQSEILYFVQGSWHTVGAGDSA